MIYEDRLNLLETFYAARLRRGIDRQVLEHDLARQVRAEDIDNQDPAGFAKKILDAAEERNRKAVV